MDLIIINSSLSMGELRHKDGYNKAGMGREAKTSIC